MGQNVIFPDTTVTKLPAQQEVLNTAHKVLFIGQKVAAGTAVSGTLYTQIGNDNSWDTLFGAKSMLAGMMRAARAENGVTRFDAIPLTDASGSAATATVAFTGTTASASGTITIYVGSKNNHKYELAVSATNTPTQIGAALETAINADTNAPFAAVNTSGSVVITAANKGTEANSFLVKYVGTVAGITTTLTGWAGGATDPTLTSIFAVIGEERYQTIVWPGKYIITEVETLLDNRWNVSGAIQDGVCVRAINDSIANVKSATNTLNSQSIVTICDKAISTASHKGAAVAEFEYVKAAKVAAIRALRLTQDASIAKYVVTTAAKDQFGGPSIATLPYANTPILTLPVVEIAMGWTRQEIEDIKTAGGSVLGNNRSNSNIILDEVVTSYLTDSAGNSDITYKYLNYVDTISNVAEYFFNNAISDFKQTRLTTGSLRQGFDINNEKSIRAAFVGYYQALTGDTYLLLQDGEAALTFFKDNLTVEVDLALGKVTISCKVPIITQLRTILATVQVAFDIE